MAEFITFFFGAAVILAGAIGVVVARNAVHSALFLIQTLLGVAVIFVVQEAHFLAAVQIVVYAGAIVILFLFVIMLLGVDKAEDLGVEPIAGQKPLAVVLGASLLATAITFVLVATDGATGVGSGDLERQLDSGITDIERIGRVLFTEYAVAFQLTAALLTIGVIGAVVLTRSLSSTGQLDDLSRRRWTPVAGARGGQRRTPCRHGRGGRIVILAELALTPPYYLVLSALMFAVGATGLLIRRNPLVMFMCVELMLNGVNISFVAFGADLNDVGGQISVFFVLVVAAVEVVVGLALVVAINRRRADATADDVSLEGMS